MIRLIQMYGDNKMFTYSVVVVFLCAEYIQATSTSIRDDLQDKELKEIKEIVKLQAEMLQKYGQRIDILEKGNEDLVQQIEAWQMTYGVKKSTSSRRNQSRQSTPGFVDHNRIEDERSRMRRVADVDNQTAVGFYSRLVSPHPLQLGQHQAIEFDYVVTNAGNAYDSRQGRFTAQVAGLYSFSSTALLESSSNHHMHLSIVKNGVDVGVLFSLTAYDTGTRTVVLSLAVGDMVWVRNNENNSPKIFDLGIQDISNTTPCIQHKLYKPIAISCSSDFTLPFSIKTPQPRYLANHFTLCPAKLLKKRTHNTISEIQVSPS